jgi:AcrR family transcriptional regulator
MWRSLASVDNSVYNGGMNLLNPTFSPDLPARERILATAHRLFYREGIRATGIARVIAESGVTKVTFYRHFPSKNDLIREFLEARHQAWTQWFDEALQRHGGTLQALLPALAEWFSDAAFRGCAFINSVGELGETLPEVREIALRHKADMATAIASLLSPTSAQAEDAEALAVAVDGAIIRAQFDRTPEAALRALGRVLAALSGLSAER